MQLENPGTDSTDKLPANAALKNIHFAIQTLVYLGNG